MNPRALIIGREQEARVKEIVAYAKAHVLPCNRLMALSYKPDPAKAIGLDLNLRMEFPIGYRVVYNQEEQPVHGICHHISISVDDRGREEERMLPGEPAVNAIMEAFGMKTTVREALFIYMEPLDYGGGGAINIIEPLERKADGPKRPE